MGARTLRGSESGAGESPGPAFKVLTPAPQTPAGLHALQVRSGLGANLGFKFPAHLAANARRRTSTQRPEPLMLSIRSVQVRSAERQSTGL
jgi:hypothetical protein